MAKRKTTEQFIEDARKVHGNKYDYRGVEYINNQTKVTITCPEHGDFTQQPNNHLQGNGCVKCVKNILKSTEEFIRASLDVHRGLYNYNKTSYKNSTTKVTITCKEHGEFIQSPILHLKGAGCPKCADIERGKMRTLLTIKSKDWNFTQPDDYKLITLTQGKFAKVDNEDFERCKDINWNYTTIGYATNGRVGYMHRYIMNAPDYMLVDHKEIEETLDNRKSNLRLATKAQNQRNRRPKEGTSHYKGVDWLIKNKKWRGRIRFKGMEYTLGSFDDEIECAKAYDRKALELFDEFAYLNFPELKEEYLKEIYKDEEI